LVLLAVLIALYWRVAGELARQWWVDPNYSHGFLVPFLSAFLIWQRRNELTALRAQGSWLGLPVLLVGVGALLLGDLSFVIFLTGSSLIMVLAGLVLFHLGREILWLLAFPLLFLLFMVPMPDSLFDAIALPLQNLAARNAAWTLEALGVAVLLQGNVIHLSQISLGVTEACSGIRSLVSLLAVAVAWAYLSLSGIWGMVGLVAAAVPITILANVGRIVATGLIGQWLGVEYARGVFHSLSGWATFFFAFVCLLGVHTVIRLAERRGQRLAP
jgi:exosortase